MVLTLRSVDARGTTWTRVLGAAALAIGLVATDAHAAHAETLSADENARLMRGETITREETLERGEDHRYVGGVTYTVVDASADEIATLLEDVAAYKQILPRTKRARIVGVDGSDFFVELRQGNAIAEAAYTIRVRRDPAKREVRFWLDPSRPHGIDDAWGFFRYEPLAQVTPGVPRVLLTYGVLVDLGPGIVRDLFEERLRALMLSVPQRVREYVWRAIRPRRPGAHV
jgi:hypothetical protein